MLQKAAGLSPDRIAAIRKDPSQADLEDKDKALLLFVLKALKSPNSIVAEDVKELGSLGWSDADILDAASHGAQMIAAGILYEAFKMDQD
jgi:hypothetical protein